MLAADPAPPHWGGNASLYAWSAAVNMTNPSDAPLHPHWTFNYSYDWTLSASRYDHAQGQHDEVCKMAVTERWRSKKSATRPLSACWPSLHTFAERHSATSRPST